MARDFIKFSEWLEKTVQARVADEQALLKLKLIQESRNDPDGKSAQSKKAS